jgi:FkbM family methyltransferase
MTLTDDLTGQFVVVNLGAADDGAFDLPSRYRHAMTLIELDAVTSAADRSQVHKRHSLTHVVAGSAQPRQFTSRAFPQCSGLLEPRPELVQRYGLEEYFVVVDTIEVETRTLSQVLDETGVGIPDFVKTDLEGVDMDVLYESASTLDGTLGVMCELRFEPFFVGEPPFHEAVGQLEQLGFELIGLEPEMWKPATHNQTRHRDGRTVYANCLFLRHLDGMDADSSPLRRAKLILVACMMGHRSYAEFLFERWTASLPEDWHTELRDLTEPAGRDWRDYARPIVRAIRQRVRREPFDFSHIVVR